MSAIAVDAPLLNTAAAPLGRCLPLGALGAVGVIFAGPMVAAFPACPVPF